MLKYSLVVFLFVFSFAFAGTQKDNTIIFEKGSDVNSLSMDFNKVVSVTRDQPYEENSFKKHVETDKSLTVVYSAGRQKSVETATEFNNVVGNAYGFFATYRIPVELNFAVETTLKINDSPLTSSFYIAQGSNGGGINDWWIGCKDCWVEGFTANLSNGELIVTTKDNSKYKINTDHGFPVSHHTFKISKIN